MSSLIAFINQHDGCRVESVQGLRLTVSSLCSINGRVIRVSETIDATMPAVRCWLGY
jgi:hypothetical protein